MDGKLCIVIHVGCSVAIVLNNSVSITFNILIYYPLIALMSAQLRLPTICEPHPNITVLNIHMTSTHVMQQFQLLY
jgi:hypothetical protein